MMRILTIKNTKDNTANNGINGSIASKNNTETSDWDGSAENSTISDESPGKKRSIVLSTNIPPDDLKNKPEVIKGILAQKPEGANIREVDVRLNGRITIIPATSHDYNKLIDPDRWREGSIRIRPRSNITTDIAIAVYIKQVGLEVPIADVKELRWVRTKRRH